MYPTLNAKKQSTQSLVSMASCSAITITIGQRTPPKIMNAVGGQPTTKFIRNLLYKEYSAKHQAHRVLKGMSLSQAENAEIQAYIDIFKANGFSKHTQVNVGLNLSDFSRGPPKEPFVLLNVRSIKQVGYYQNLELLKSPSAAV